MKILYVSSSTVPSRSANSVHVMKMCHSMAKLGHEVRLLVLDRPHQQLTGVGDVFRHYGVGENFEFAAKPFPTMLGRQGVYAGSVWQEAAQWKPDLAYGRYFPAMALLGLLGFEVAYESHERVWERGTIAKNLAKRLFAAKGFRKLVVISEALKAMYVEEGMIGGDRIIVAHDAADAVKLAPAVRENAPFKAGYIGGVYAGRGIELVLESAARLPDVEFHFVGGTSEDLARLLGAEPGPNVVCHGYQPPERVPALRATFHVLLAPYQRKVAVFGGTGDTSAFMSPLKIFEYMASGRPMICSDLPVLREVLSGANAVLCAPDDVGEWVRAIERLRDDESLAKRLATRARADFEANFTWDIRAKRILASL